MNDTTFLPPNLARSESDSRIVQRVVILVALLIVELAIFREWLNDAGNLNSAAMATLLAQRGPGTLRFVVVRFLVVFGMVSLVFIDETVIAAPRRVLSALVRRPFGWPLLLGHLVLVGAFAALSSFLYDLRLPGSLDIAFTTVWLFTGLTAGGMAVVAFVPGPFWAEVFRSIRPVATFAFFVSIGAYVFGQLALTFWFPLSRGTLSVAFTILRPLVPSVAADPANLVLGSPTFEVVIDSTSSGYDGLGLILVFTTAWLWLHRVEWRFPHALLLIPVGLGAIWMVNCFRVAMLVWIGASGAPEIAVRGFHTQAGWLGFAAVAIGICLTARRVPWLLKQGSHVALVDGIGGAGQPCEQLEKPGGLDE